MASLPGGLRRRATAKVLAPFHYNGCAGTQTRCAGQQEHGNAPAQPTARRTTRHDDYALETQIRDPGRGLPAPVLPFLCQLLLAAAEFRGPQAIRSMGPALRGCQDLEPDPRTRH